MINLLIAKIDEDWQRYCCQFLSSCSQVSGHTVCHCSCSIVSSEASSCIDRQCIDSSEASSAKKGPAAQFYGGRLSTVCKNSHLSAQVVKDMPRLILSNSDAWWCLTARVSHAQFDFVELGWLAWWMLVQEWAGITYGDGNGSTHSRILELGTGMERVFPRFGNRDEKIIPNFRERERYFREGSGTGIPAHPCSKSTHLSQIRVWFVCTVHWTWFNANTTWFNRMYCTQVNLCLPHWDLETAPCLLVPQQTTAQQDLGMHQTNCAWVHWFVCVLWIVCWLH